jgi:glycosyltransferase involved in cell wall biosynthesis
LDLDLYSNLLDHQLPTVSIIICTYQRPNSLSRLLDQIASQAHTVFSEIEVSIVNDGSHKTSHYPNSYDRYPFKVTYLARGRHVDGLPRVYSSKNIAVQNSTNDILWFLDDDLIIDDHTLFILRLYQMAYASKGVVLRAHEANPQDPVHFQAPFFFTPQDWSWDKLRVYPSFAGLSMHRQIWDDLGGLDEDYDLAMGFCDLDAGIRLWQLGYNIVQVDGISVWIDDSETGSHRDKFVHLGDQEHRNGEVIFKGKWSSEEVAKWPL